MNILFIGKRFYTNRDALRERFGRIYQLPWHWAAVGIHARLWLIDYHTREKTRLHDGALEVISTPAISWSSIRKLGAEAFGRQALGEKPQVVIASGDCYLGLMAYRLAKRVRAHFVFDVYDKYDEFSTYRRLPGFDPFSFLLKHSDNRLFASRALMERIGSQSRRDFIVPNGIDMERFRPLDMRESRRSLGLPEDVVLVGYFGSMEPDRGVDDLIAAVHHLRGDGMPIELLLGGKARPDINLQQSGIRYLGNLPFDRVPDALASCDVLAMPYRHSPFLNMAASCKTAEYIASGRPIAATRTPNLIANFPEAAIRLQDVLATPEDVVDIARTIRMQVAQRITVDMPEGMDWASIANALALDLSFSKEQVNAAQI